MVDVKYDLMPLTLFQCCSEADRNYTREGQGCFGTVHANESSVSLAMNIRMLAFLTHIISVSPLAHALLTLLNLPTKTTEAEQHNES